ncbi:MAG: 2-C-methyl-D-erythritol 4-phosphate cytidylyltransferase [Coriobacteriia bacterium]|nr:2-C-methyl-D-erythritol 4-phosphate cytidylyltransferase [Coriobacteriia bacterium]
MRVVAIIAAAGVGERFGRPGGKQLVSLAGATVLEHALRPFVSSPLVDAIVVVAHPRDVAAVRRLTGSVPRILCVVPGGATRQESIRRGLEAVPHGAEIVVVHDGARPLLTTETLERVLEALGEGADAAIVGHPCYDTVKRVRDDGFVERTEDRSGLWLVQTPQAFRTGILRHALEQASSEGIEATDDASLVERYGGRVRVVLGPRDNLKVTVAEDLAIAEALLSARTSDLKGAPS